MIEDCCQLFTANSIRGNTNSACLHAYVHINAYIHAHTNTYMHTYIYTYIHTQVIEDCCQLVKANSIRGNKLDNVSVVFTPASNLKKTNGMEVGQVCMYVHSVCTYCVYAYVKGSFLRPRAPRKRRMAWKSDSMFGHLCVRVRVCVCIYIYMFKCMPFSHPQAT